MPATTHPIRRAILLGSAAVGLTLGAAGVASAVTGSGPAPAHAPAPATPHNEVNGVDCADGIIVATGAQCDGGPAANQANDATEPKGKEDKANGKEDTAKSPEADEVSGVDCQDGIIVATGAQCDGGPAANPTDGAADGAEG